MCRVRGICNLSSKDSRLLLNATFEERFGLQLCLLYEQNSALLHCCFIFSIVAALSPPPIASRFREVIFRRRSPFVDSDFVSLPELYFPSSQPFVTSSVVALFHRLRPQIASATLSSVVAGRLLPSTQPFVDFSLPRLRIPSSQPFVDSSRHLPSSQPFTVSGRKSLPRLYLPSSQPFVDSFRRRSLSSTPRFRDFRVDAAFSRLLPSSQPFVDSDFESLPRL